MPKKSKSKKSEAKFREAQERHFKELGRSFDVGYDGNKPVIKFGAFDKVNSRVMQFRIAGYDLLDNMLRRNQIELYQWKAGTDFSLDYELTEHPSVKGQAWDVHIDKTVGPSSAPTMPLEAARRMHRAKAGMLPLHFDILVMVTVRGVSLSQIAKETGSDRNKLGRDLQLALDDAAYWYNYQSDRPRLLAPDAV